MLNKDLFRERVKCSENYILESLFIIMRKKAFAEINVTEIATKAGLHRTTFYRNFKNKEDIVKSFYKYLLCEYLETIIVKKPASPQAHMTIFFECVYTYKSEIMLLYANNLDHYFMGVAKQMYSEQYCNRGILLEEEFAMNYHYGGVYSVLHWWCSNELAQDPHEMVRIFFDMQGICLQGSQYRYKGVFETEL